MKNKKIGPTICEVILFKYKYFIKVFQIPKNKTLLEYFTDLPKYATIWWHFATKILLNLSIRNPVYFPCKESFLCF